MYRETSATGTMAASAVDTDSQRPLRPGVDSSLAPRTLSSTQTLVPQESRTETAMMAGPETAPTAWPRQVVYKTMSGQCHRYSE